MVAFKQAKRPRVHLVASSVEEAREDYKKGSFYMLEWERYVLVGEKLDADSVEENDIVLMDCCECDESGIAEIRKAMRTGRVVIGGFNFPNQVVDARGASFNVSIQT